MNQIPASFTLPLENETFIVLVSCYEQDNEESRAICFQQLVTKHDSDSFEKGEDETCRASITVMPSSAFPGSATIAEWNSYTLTDQTKMALKAYYVENGKEATEETIKPFYGKVVFEEDKIGFLGLATNVEAAQEPEVLIPEVI